MSKPLRGSATFHDSCYLGRYNNEYDSPRYSLRAAGLDLIEMEHSREDGFCCGGGGGRAWFELENTGASPTHSKPGTDFAQVPEVRLQDAIAINAGQIATACPFCLMMLDSAVQGDGSPETVVVRDVAQLVAEAI